MSKTLHLQKLNISSSPYPLERVLTPSFQSPIAQLIDQVAFSDSKKNALQKILNNGNASNLREAILQLNFNEKEQLFSRISEDSLKRLISTSQESRPDLFRERLFAFAEEQKNAGKSEVAAATLGLILSSGVAHGRALLLIVSKAQASLKLLQGHGSPWEQLEYSTTRFFPNTLGPVSIVPMMGAMMVGGRVATWGLNQLTLRGIIGGLRARFAASGLALAVEGPTFVTIGNVMKGLSGERVHTDLNSLAKETLMATMTVGGFKATSFVGNQLFRGLHQFNELGNPTRLINLQRFTKVVIPYSSMWQGVYWSHQIEASFQMRPQETGILAVMNTTSSLFSLTIGAKAAHFFHRPNLVVPIIPSNFKLSEAPVKSGSKRALTDVHPFPLGLSSLAGLSTFLFSTAAEASSHLPTVTSDYPYFPLLLGAAALSFFKLQGASPTPKSILITGASSGFGKLTAELLLVRGHHVIAGMRGGETRLRETFSEQSLATGRISAIDLHLDQPATFQEAARVVQERFNGKLDVLINNAGYGLFGPLEMISRQQMLHQMQVNFLGPRELTQILLPALRIARGKIINMSSVVGFMGFPFYGAYNASKFALEGASEALRYELKPDGVQVGLVEPGGFRTEFQSNAIEMRKDVPSDSPLYAERIKSFNRFVAEKNERKSGDPRKVANLLVKLSEKPQIPLRSIVGGDAWMGWISRRILPESWRINIQDYFFRKSFFRDEKTKKGK